MPWSGSFGKQGELQVVPGRWMSSRTPGSPQLSCPRAVPGPPGTVWCCLSQQRLSLSSPQNRARVGLRRWLRKGRSPPAHPDGKRHGEGGPTSHRAHGPGALGRGNRADAEPGKGVQHPPVPPAQDACFPGARPTCCCCSTARGGISGCGVPELSATARSAVGLQPHGQQHGSWSGHAKLPKPEEQTAVCLVSFSPPPAFLNPDSAGDVSSAHGCR